ncbi:MAG: riboflavin synthase [Spirochaetales bacterium]|nr:riboflavin synthase [Spirochaetales bacterium]
MFTGLIRHLGVIRSVREGRESRVLTLAHDFARAPRAGASIAVQGVCLTVLPGADGRLFSAECHYATLKKSTLQFCRPGQKVHLEPALTLSDPLDGHLVQGHVSAMASVMENRPAGRGRSLTMELPESLRTEICREGSVALDGVSLTVATLEEHSFSIQLIGETLRTSLLGSLHRGEKVNVEGDLLLRNRPARGAGEFSKQKSTITEQQLLQWGYV